MLFETARDKPGKMKSLKALQEIMKIYEREVAHFDDLTK